MVQFLHQSEPRAERTIGTRWTSRAGKKVLAQFYRAVREEAEPTHRSDMSLLATHARTSLACVASNHEYRI